MSDIPTTKVGREMCHWIVWDQTTSYTSDDTAIDDLPEDGILGVLACYSDGRAIRHAGNDWYFYDGVAKEFWCTYGTLAELNTRYPTAQKILQGQWAATTRFDEVVAEMINCSPKQPGFPWHS